jgi:Exosome complex exonuclease Rrp40 N-terminal domain
MAVDQVNRKIFERSTTRTMTSGTAMTDVEDTVRYPHLILPGELLSTVLSQPLKLGPGLRHSTSPNGETLIQATQAGLLHKTKHSEFYVDYNSRRVDTCPLVHAINMLSPSALRLFHQALLTIVYS